MGDLKVVTNNRPRLLLDWDQLTPREQREFDYLTDEDRFDRDFVRYRGVAYDLGEFETPGDSLKPWDGVKHDSFFSGVVVRWDGEDRDRVVMGTIYA